jgi:hypothetical protein
MLRPPYFSMLVGLLGGFMGGASVGAGGSAVFGGDDIGGVSFAGGMGRGDISVGASFVSASVLSVVLLVAVVDGNELVHVRPEKVLESDCRGKADLDLLSNEKSSKTNPRVISSSSRSSSSDEFPSSYSRVRAESADCWLVKDVSRGGEALTSFENSWPIRSGRGVGSSVRLSSYAASTAASRAASKAAS